MTEIHPDQRYIEGILYHDPDILNEIYKKFSGGVWSFVLKHGGTPAEAGMIFQETLIDLFQQVKYKGFRLICAFEPFFISLCERKWILKERQNGDAVQQKINLPAGNKSYYVIADQVEKTQHESILYLALMNQLNERCRDIIRSSVNREKEEALADKMRISYDYFKKKKAECMTSLVKIIKGTTSNEVHR